MRFAPVLLTATLSLLAPALATSGPQPAPTPKLKVVFVSDGNVPPKSGWKTDGSPAATADLALLAQAHTTGMNLDGQIVRNITLCVRLEVGPTDDAQLYAPGAEGSKGDGTPIRSVHYLVPSSQKTLNARFGLATGPFHIVGEGAPGVGPLDPIAEDLPGSGTGWYGILSLCTVQVTIPPSAKGEDLHLTGYDSAGKSLKTLKFFDPLDQMADPTLTERSFKFNAPAEKVARVELSARPIQWTTVKDIPLKRGRTVQ